uniref:UPF0481 protein At3g47200 n=1 Tax=Elaeis guineensis var. tenera TaxID=51953 RepID=A0A6I9QMV8_ELAGV|nr:UPF0481 protein At3g47200 [Elaeis guineensis]
MDELLSPCAGPASYEPEDPSYTERVMPSTSRKTDEDWIKKVRDRVKSACPVHHADKPCTIFKVPEHIRQLAPKAYEPVIASLGPFHHHLYASCVITDHKWRCVWHLLSRHESQEYADKLLDECLMELKERDAEVRNCYSEVLPRRLDAQNLALIMLLDGCFIIYLMLKMHARIESSREQVKKDQEQDDTVGKLEDKTGKEGEDKKMKECTTEAGQGELVLTIDQEKEKLPPDPTVAGLFTLDLVIHDLLKLENQIPFDIIQLLFDKLKPCEDEKIDLVDLALQLFKDIHPNESKSFKKKSPREYHHLLHLFHSSRITSEKLVKSKWKKAEVASSQGSTQGTLTSAPKWIPSAIELGRCGVKFKRKEPADNFLDITFEWRKIKVTPLFCLLKLWLMFRSGRMEIPPLQIYDYTDALFRNLIAFEQCYFDTEMYITIYALFMDCIIDQAEDVRLLHLEDILEHKLSNDQAVAELFNKLGCQIRFTWKKNYLTNQIMKINNFCDSRWHKWLAALRRDYLGNPWAIISVLAAFILLLLTTEQAVFSALSYHHS